MSHSLDGAGTVGISVIFCCQPFYTSRAELTCGRGGKSALLGQSIEPSTKSVDLS